MNDDTSRAAEQPRIESLCRASVRVGTVETWYTTWGRGPSVVVLLSHPLGWAPGEWLRSIGGAHSRLIVPEVPRGMDAQGLSAWFGDFLDGLGLDRVRVAAESSFDPILRSTRIDHRLRIEGPLAWVHPPYRS